MRRQVVPLRTSYCPEKNGIGFIREDAGSCGIGLATSLDRNTTDVPFGELQIKVMSSPHRFKHSPRLLDDFGADPVTGQ
jgi:hypothetical protein